MSENTAVQSNRTSVHQSVNPYHGVQGKATKLAYGLTLHTYDKPEKLKTALKMGKGLVGALKRNQPKPSVEAPIEGGALVEAPKKKSMVPKRLKLNPTSMLRPQGGIKLPRPVRGPVRAIQERAINAVINQGVEVVRNLPENEHRVETFGEVVGQNFSPTGFFNGARRLTSAFVRGILRGSDTQDHAVVRHTINVWNAVSNGAYAALTAVHRTWNWLRGN